MCLLCRMKQDVKNENYNMFDLIAYRIKFLPHPHAGTGWCIYPSYDFTHCLVAVLEDVTHSLCTLEFESRRASFFWLLEVTVLVQPIAFSCLLLCAFAFAGTIQQPPCMSVGKLVMDDENI